MQSTARHTFFRRTWVLIRETVKAYFDDNISRLGAALAYYTTFAVTPLLVLAIAVAGILFEQQSARDRVISEISRLAGSDAGKAIQQVSASASPSSNRIATAVGIVTLLFGGFSVFLHLQDALNAIFRAPQQPPEPFLATMKRRLFSLATVLGTGFLLIVSLIVSTILNWFAENAASRLNWPPGIMEGINVLVSLVVIACLFAIIFKFLPDVPVRWKSAVRGGVITAILFDIGKTGLSFYFAKANVLSSYGVAGSLILLLLWTYYAGQIVFVGAEVTRIHDLTRGGREPENIEKKDPTAPKTPGN
ncbi:MAG TPA: YihY/virulence factor BrkB family protein [Opitutaceae bacterium]